MNLEETEKYLQQAINSNKTQLYSGLRKMCTSAHGIISLSFKKWKADEKVDITKKEISDVEKSINMLLAYVVDNPISNDFNKFAKTYCLFIKNWLDNVNKQGNINGPWIDIMFKIKSVVRLVDSHFTMLEMMNMCRQTVEKMKTYHKRYEPPIELARHYLKSLEDSGVVEDPNYCCGTKDSSKKSSENTSCNTKRVDKEVKKAKVKLGVWTTGDV